MAVIRSTLTSRGYNLYETVLVGTDFGVLEARERMVFVAITKGLDVDFSFPEKGKKTTQTVADILDSEISLSSDRWKAYEYLAIKEERDKANGKGFRRQLISYDSTSVGTMTRGYQKVRSTDPHLQHPENSTLSRLFTPLEHARLKGVPQSLIEGLSETMAHELLGQSVIGPVFEAVGYSLGLALTNQKPKPVFNELVVSGVIDFPGQETAEDGVTDWDVILEVGNKADQVPQLITSRPSTSQIALEFA